VNLKELKASNTLLHKKLQEERRRRKRRLRNRPKRNNRKRWNYRLQRPGKLRNNHKEPQQQPQRNRLPKGSVWRRAQVVQVG
jgi:hypothetical protein